jgi:hypothetical protein
VDHPAFRAGDLHTGFVDEHLAELGGVGCPPAEAIAAAMAALHVGTRSPGTVAAAPPDPWSSLGGWRLT